MATTHYVCTGGCLTVRYAPNNKCTTPGCPRHRNPLTECNCEDDLHGDLLHRNHPGYKIVPPITPKATKTLKKSAKVTPKTTKKAKNKKA